MPTAAATTAARTLANRKNALKSTGPKTEEGKARSRANAFKHGLAGQGVAWPDEEQAEVEAFVKEHVRLERPQDAREGFLAARAAVLGWQILRADRIEAAHAHARSGRGVYMELERRDREVDALVDRIDTEPHRAVRSLLRTKEGCTWVLKALHEFLDAAKEERVLPSQNLRLDALCLPPLPGLLRGSRARMLVEAICHDTEAVWPQGVPGLDEPADDAPKSEWSLYHTRKAERVVAHRPIWHAELREVLSARIAEVEDLLAELRAEPDPALELAELTASFDDTPAGERLRRYRRASLRERRQALEELDAWRSGTPDRESRPEADLEPETPAPPSASSPSPAPTPAPEPAEPPVAERPPSPRPRSAAPAPAPAPAHVPRTQAEERLELAKQWLRSAPAAIPTPHPLS